MHLGISIGFNKLRLYCHGPFAWLIFIIGSIFLAIYYLLKFYILIIILPFKLIYKVILKLINKRKNTTNETVVSDIKDKN